MSTGRTVRLSLQSRLLLGTVGLLAITSAIVGVASVAILHQSLVDKMDQQLSATLGRGQMGFDDDRDGNRPGANQSADAALRVPGQAVGTIGVVLAGDRVLSAAVVTERGAVNILAPNQQATLPQFANLDGIETVHLRGLGSYRAISATLPNGVTVVFALPLAAAQATSAQLAWTIAGVAVLSIALAAYAGSLVIRRSLAPLTRVTEAARGVSEMALDRGGVALGVRVPEDDERTEVGQLGAAFNRMLGHVAQALAAREQSELKVRQFVADASHELRTPLASIRGYAELTRLSPEPLPVDATHALGRIEAETIRMTALVEDLLLLARLDEGRELTFTPVDLTPVLVQLVADARAAGPNHVFTLVEPDGPMVVAADEPRLRQVLINLIANARVHTPEGTEIRISVQAGEDTVAVLIHDNGPGVDPSVVDSLFERFARADTSRSRHAGSTGLGLAIASAVAQAHGGELTLKSAPGDTTFTLSLPRMARVG